MKKSILLVMASLMTTLGCAEETASTDSAPATVANAPAGLPEFIPPKQTGAPPASSTISVQEMLVTGPPQIKFHSLAMIAQGNVKGAVDESYLPGLTVCSDDPSSPIRSITAQLLGRFFVQGIEPPNPEAIELLIKLSRDESPDVRFNAVYHGLTQIRSKSDKILNLLIEMATTEQEQSLYDRIAESLGNDRERVIGILDRKLQEGDNIAIYEVYEDLTGQKPANADKYLAMPSSRPRLFIFTGEASDPAPVKTELEKILKAEGIENPDIQVSSMGQNYVLFLKTYITRDYQTVERTFSDHPTFKFSQDMWLTPQMEIQIETMLKMKP